MDSKALIWRCNNERRCMLVQPPSPLTMLLLLPPAISTLYTHSLTPKHQHTVDVETYTCDCKSFPLIYCCVHLCNSTPIPRSRQWGAADFIMDLQAQIPQRWKDKHGWITAWLWFNCCEFCSTCWDIIEDPMAGCTHMHSTTHAPHQQSFTTQLTSQHYPSQLPMAYISSKGQKDCT